MFVLGKMTPPEHKRIPAIQIAVTTLALACLLCGACNSIPPSDNDGGSDDTESENTDPENCRRYAAPWGGNVLESDGLTWESAFSSVIDAVDQAATEAPCDVWVAAGIYYVLRASRNDTIQMEPGVRILGGFAGDETTSSKRDPVANLTILDGRVGPDNDMAVYHILTGASNATIDGFTIRNGRADGDFPDSIGAGLLNFSVSPTVSNCRFENNTGNSSESGGAIDNRYSSPHVTDTVFVSNKGAVRNCWNSNPVFERCVFDDNEGGIRVRDSSGVTIIDCAFYDNGDNGAVSLSGPCCGDALIVNTVFYRNASYYGGAITADDTCVPQIINCTFVDNYAVSENGAALAAIENAGATVINSIFWGNEPAQIFGNGNAPLTVSHSVVQGGYEGTDVVDGDPLLADMDWLHFEPLAGSPCIDAADGSRAPEKDMAGNARHDDPSTGNNYECVEGDSDCCEFADIGALEYLP